MAFTTWNTSLQQDFQQLVIHLATGFINIPLDDIDNKINDALSLIGEFVGVDRCLILTYETRQEDLYVSMPYEWCRPGIKSKKDQIVSLKMSRTDWIYQQLAKGKTVRVTDVLDMPSQAKTSQERLINTGVRSFVSIPLMEDNQIVGALGYDMVEPHSMWPEETLTLLRIVGEIFQNAMARKHAEEQRLQMALEHEKMKMLRVFIDNISHDLKTPITVIQTTLALMKFKGESAGSKDRLQILLEQARLLESLVQNLLTASRLEYMPEVSRGNVDLNALVHKVVKHLKPTIEDHGHNIVLDLDPSLEIMQLEEMRIMRLLTNLVENAIHYTPRDGTITIATRKGNDSALMAVSDTGIGIPEEDLPHIFDRFFRSKQAQSIARSGSGLGLFVVKQITELHGGHVEVISKLGEGTQFSITLPFTS